MITYDDFVKVEMRVGKIIEVDEFPEARRPAYKLKIDFGEALGVKKSSAQITKCYDKEELLGKQVVAVTNFPPKQIGKFLSEVLVLGVELQDGSVPLLTIDQEVPLGHKIS
ncbi:MAG: tRNA-binding protein [Clostridiaceae bacterium]|nr:tRNA-binding protein [Clostridiaceae bacterium]